MLAVELSGATESADSLSDLPDAVQDAVSTEDAVKEWAAASTDIQRFYFVGTGANASTAYEAALKMKEANYTTTEGLHLEQYLHGPFVSTDEGCLVTFIAPPSDGTEDRVVDIIKAVTEVGARTAAILQTGDSARADLVDTVVSMPERPGIYSPIVYLAPLQLLTYWLALELGCNPDVFRLNDPKHAAARQPLYALATFTRARTMRNFRIALAQINPTVGDLEGNSRKAIEYIERARESRADLIAFPELAIPGYPPEDLLLKPQFLEENRRFMESVVEHSEGIAVHRGLRGRRGRRSVQRRGHRVRRSAHRRLSQDVPAQLRRLR